MGAQMNPIWRSTNLGEKKKRISHYIFACFMHMGAKNGVQLSTRLYIYIYAVELKLKSGPRFGGFKVKKWSKFKVKKWSKFFFTVFPHFYSVLGAF